MSELGYPAATLIAPKLQAHFAQYLERVAMNPQPGDELLSPPDVADIEAVVNAAFWASLRREEGYVPRISLAIVNPESVGVPIRFESPLPLRPTSLVKVAPAVERPGIHLGVWRRDRGLEVWGTTRTIPRFSMVLEVAAPGLLVVKHNRGDGGKYVNVAVIEGDQIKMIDERVSSRVPDCPAMLSSLLGFTQSRERSAAVDVVIDLAVSMRAHHRGGIILLVPTESDDWQESVLHPMPYAVVPSYTGLADLLKRAEAERNDRAWQEELEDTVNAIAGLTAVDGATVLNQRCDLLAFGAKITRRKGRPVLEQAAVTEPIEGGEAAVITSAQLGGTRHLSAAQFVHDQRDAMALVASQDGRFTVFAWSPCEDRVHAHRVEALLL